MTVGPERADGRASARANALLKRVQLADGHNDLPWALRELAGGTGWSEDWASADLTIRRTDLHTDLVRLREGALTMQFWSVYVQIGRAHV